MAKKKQISGGVNADLWDRAVDAYNDHVAADHPHLRGRANGERLFAMGELLNGALVVWLATSESERRRMWRAYQDGRPERLCRATCPYCKRRFDYLESARTWRLSKQARFYLPSWVMWRATVPCGFCEHTVTLEKWYGADIDPAQRRPLPLGKFPDDLDAQIAEVAKLGPYPRREKAAQ